MYLSFRIKWNYSLCSYLCCLIYIFKENYLTLKKMTWKHMKKPFYTRIIAYTYNDRITKHKSLFYCLPSRIWLKQAERQFTDKKHALNKYLLQRMGLVDNRLTVESRLVHRWNSNCVSGALLNITIQGWFTSFYLIEITFNVDLQRFSGEPDTS